MMAQTRLFNDREAYMAIKAIAMDIDGTLTNDQKVISPRTREMQLVSRHGLVKKDLIGLSVDHMRAIKGN